jgi:midasin
MSSIVETLSTTENVNVLDRALKSSRYVLVQGSVGSGKSLLLQSAAEKWNMKESLLQINVDDSFDSKDLLGKFTAADTPGTFQWTEGPLTCAVREGRWVVMEDIDLASFDVFSVLLTLLESDVLFIADKNCFIKAHPNFKLLATQQVVGFGDAVLTRKVASIPNVELWCTVLIRSLPIAECIEIVSARYPSCPQDVVLPVLNDVMQRTGRAVSLRDVLKWACRVQAGLPSTSSSFVSSTIRERMLREAHDSFVARLPPGQERVDLSASLSQNCGVSTGVADTMFHHHKPAQASSPTHFSVGRVTLPKLKRDAATRDSRVVFSQTQHSMSLLEQIASCALFNEPVLLTGETGVGKTFIVQYLADQLGQELIVHNLNQQTDASDFMGGWKPQEIGQLVRPLYTRFVELFSRSFNAEKNAAFLAALRQSIDRRMFEVALRQFQKGFDTFLSGAKQQQDYENLRAGWEKLQQDTAECLSTVERAKSSFYFKFEEGSLVRAWKEGHWILLDEVNLATNEVLERVSSVLGDANQLFVTERGDVHAIPRHPNFRVFANMNPPTDVGKKELPPALRSKFTELYVADPFSKADLCTVVGDFIGFLSPDARVEEIASFFLNCVRNARTLLCDLDGESQPPHFSLRTLTRSLTYVRNATSLYGFHVALLDGLMLGFATPLQRKFHSTVQEMIIRDIFRGKRPPPPTLPKLSDPSKFTHFEHIWLELGPHAPQTSNKFILTASVKAHLVNLSRAVFAKRPVLLEGPTSAGKSSMVQYLAELTGHKFVRINNHDNTEVQEYIGHYISDEQGKLRFVDGILVDAVRNGHWVVLDELNLAPTDVLEALNRLLDDNCELFIADTQETVKPHPSLRIFATQNPAGIYGGRKLLSRAFRNRFLEIIVDDIPNDEVKEILCKRFNLPPSFAEKMVGVMNALQLRRQGSHLFAGKHGYITPRDLFRWSERHPETYQELAEHGYLLLAERCRRDDEKQTVKDVISSVMKVELDENMIYSPEHWPFVQNYYQHVNSGLLDDFKIVWTPSMRRLFTIIGIALQRMEPVLLVGETGSSKTTVCQLWAKLLERPLSILNCHQHTEAADFLGGLRPSPAELRDQALFQWVDGPLVRAMKSGGMFVLDEISIAEDSVLERLNSVLEPSRSLTLAEKSSADMIVAVDDFRILATMNPGGDFGKKELSPALRNRFTEIYVRPMTDAAEVATIVGQRLSATLQWLARPMANLLCEASLSKVQGNVQHMSIRDIVAWVAFMNAVEGSGDTTELFFQGLDAVILDGCSVGAGQSEKGANEVRESCLKIAKRELSCENVPLDRPFWDISSRATKPEMPDEHKHSFFFGSPTTMKNLSKLLRALVLPKAVLLEGSPGVGKTSIVESLGLAMGRHTVRINLSDQTDIMDLFGTYLPQPEEGGSGPRFSWSDGILLRAVKDGHWVILDELNLASQAVLEGLNALLDHRQTVYIPELCQEIQAAEGFRIFACQNPLLEGGGRKGLPRSFLNRFTRVRVNAFSRDDMVDIMTALCSDFDRKIVESMVDFVSRLQHEVTTVRSFGSRGGPWEFNLRDMLRWAKMMRQANDISHPENHVLSLFILRFRSEADANAARSLFKEVTGVEVPPTRTIDFSVRGETILSDGKPLVNIHRTTEDQDFVPSRKLLLLPSQTNVVDGVLRCVANNQFALLVGCAGSGKTKALQTAACLASAKLITFSLTSSCDAVDLLGSFDQVEGKEGQFEWRDSVLLEAMIQGHWLVLDNANFCNASALDRLNPVVEPNGYLVISEQGLVQGETRIVRPHPNFRLFATMDPKYGEISRAMRNRAIEFYLFPFCIPSIESTMVGLQHTVGSDTRAVDAVASFHHRFLQWSFGVNAKQAFDASMSDAISAGAPNNFTFIKSLEMIEAETSEEIREAVRHRYLRNRTGSWANKQGTLNEEIDAMSLDRVAEWDSIDLQHASVLEHLHSGGLDKVRVRRSALHMMRKDRVHRPEHDLLFFLLDMCYDAGFASEATTSERLAVLDRYGSANNLTIATSSNLLSTFASIDELWIRLEFAVGHYLRCSEALSDPLHISDSASVNRALVELLASLKQFFSSASILIHTMKIAKFTNELLKQVQVLHQSGGFSERSSIGLVCCVMLIASAAKKSNCCEAVVIFCENFLDACRRYLGTSLAGGLPALIKRRPRTRATTEKERHALTLTKQASDRHVEDLPKVLAAAAPFLSWFRHHSELNMTFLLIAAVSTSDSQILRELHVSIDEFVRKLVTEEKLLTDLDVSLWRVVRSISQVESPQLYAIVPPICASVFLTDNHVLSFFPGTWLSAALRPLLNASQASIFSVGRDSEAAEICSALRRVCERTLKTVDLVHSLKQAGIREWRSIARDFFQFPDESSIEDCSERNPCSRETLRTQLKGVDETMQAMTEYMVLCIVELVEGSPFVGMLLLGVLKCHALQPRSMIDPILKWNMKMSFASNEHNRLLELVKAFQSFENDTFRPFSKQVENAQLLLAAERVALQQAAKKTMSRPDPTGAQFVEYVQLVRATCGSLLSQERVKSLVSSTNRSHSAVSRDEVLQSWSSLVRDRAVEILRQFGGYEDFSLPMVQALLMASLGGESEATSGSFRADADDLKPLLFFPDMTPGLVVPTIPVSEIVKLEQYIGYLSSCLDRLAQDSVIVFSKRSTVKRLFDTYRSVFSSVEALEEKEKSDEAAAVRYREKANVIEGDDEKRLRHLREMFPSYDDDFKLDDEEGDEDQELGVTERRARHARLLFSNGGVVLHLAQVHRRVFEGMLKPSQTLISSSDTAAPLYFAKRFDYATSLLQGDKIEMSTDEESMLCGGFVTRTMLVEVGLCGLDKPQMNAGVDGKVQSGFNIFLDPEPSEAALATGTVKLIHQFATKMLLEYPDNPTLIRMKKIVARLVALPAMKTPLMKVMAGCEVLLRECYEWERNASKEVSIITEINALATHVLRWRRLELHCWPHIFQAKRREFSSRASMHWFAFRDMCDAVRVGDEGIFSSMFQFCADFMWKSTLGEFNARLSLLEAFALELLTSEKRKAANLLLQIWSFFKQFARLLSTELQRR